MSDILASLRAQGVYLSGITDDSRQVQSGNLFLAFPGSRTDGRQFITQAIAQGAAAVAWDAAGFIWQSQWRVPNFPLPHLREQCGVIADAFYQHPSEKLWMVGITGTNGKTSCSHWLAQAMNSMQRRTALLGTLGNGFPESLSSAINTTPAPILLHGMLHEYLQQGAQAAVMEASSHGLEQGRLNGVHFDVALLTNLSRDHLDYHSSMAAYAAAKRKLFEWEGLACSVLNADDVFGMELADDLTALHRPVLTYGFSDAAMVRGSALTLGARGMSMTVTTPLGSVQLAAALVGRFNASNLLAVLSVLLGSGVSLTRAAEALATIKPVAGRMQQLGGGHLPLVVVDYAHTPAALENVLTALREQGGGRLYCVFGCGGDRDPGKRPLMGEIASRLADKVIVTSDNPRSEDADTIIAAIQTGIVGSHEVISDRATAIASTLKQAAAGDIVLIAGKGHEAYQEIAGVRYPFSDAAVAGAVLQELSQ